MKAIAILLLTLLFSLSSGLHLHTQALPIYADNLESSNQCYYFGNLQQASYYSNQNNFRRSNPSVQSCPPIFPYANYRDGNYSCFKCDDITQGLDLSKAKVLFNVETRLCEVCVSGKNGVCDKLIGGTYFTSSTSTSTTSASTSPQTSPTTATQPSTTTTQTTTTTTQATTNNSTQTTTQTSSSNTSTSSQQTSTSASSSTQTSTANSTAANKSATASTTDLNCPPERPVYHEDTKLCDSCPPGTEFIGTKQECVPKIYVTNPAAKDLILTNITELIDLNKKVQKDHPEQVVQFCPDSEPYAQLNKCIRCSYQRQYYYVTTQACVTGCPEGTYYDDRVMRCAPALFYSDVNAAGLVSQSDNYDKWKAEVDYQASSSPRMTKCPSIKPYQQNGTCIACEGGSLFDIDQKKCVSCSQGREYNSSKRRCLGIVNYDHSMKTFASGVV